MWSLIPDKIHSCFAVSSLFLFPPPNSFYWFDIGRSRIHPIFMRYDSHCHWWGRLVDTREERDRYVLYWPILIMNGWHTFCIGALERNSSRPECRRCSRFWLILLALRLNLITVFPGPALDLNHLSDSSDLLERIIGWENDCCVDERQRYALNCTLFVFWYWLSFLNSSIYMLYAINWIIYSGSSIAHQQ